MPKRNEPLAVVLIKKESTDACLNLNIKFEAERNSRKKPRVVEVKFCKKDFKRFPSSEKTEVKHKKCLKKGKKTLLDLLKGENLQFSEFLKDPNPERFSACAITGNKIPSGGIIPKEIKYFESDFCKRPLIWALRHQIFDGESTAKDDLDFESLYGAELQKPLLKPLSFGSFNWDKF